METALSKKVTGRPSPPDKGGPHFAQVDLEAIERWGDLMVSHPRAAQLLAILIRRMGPTNAITVSQKTLAKIAGVHERTVRRMIQELEKNKWIQVVRLNGPGTVCSYIVNAKVAWTQGRDKLKTAVFYSSVIADHADQVEEIEQSEKPLMQIPSMFSNEIQLPSGQGTPPPSEPSLPGLEPEIPAIDREDVDWSTGLLLNNILNRLDVEEPK
jgi:DNA-binding transcriptional regulator YhcF (GntR family)